MAQTLTRAYWEVVTPQTYGWQHALFVQPGQSLAPNELYNTSNPNHPYSIGMRIGVQEGPVATVPLPAAARLLLSGLGGVGMLGRRGGARGA